MSWLSPASLWRPAWFVIAAFAASVGAAERVVTPDDDLQCAINAASPGDTLVMARGRHAGGVVIDRPLRLTGRAGAVIAGDGRSHVITVAAADVTISHLHITGSGAQLSSEDSGIMVTATGDRALIHDNILERNLIGVYLKGPNDARVLNNRVIGRDDLRLSESGNGIHLWNTPGSLIEGNDISNVRDGIFVTTSRDNTFRGNRFRDLRFAIHYMYTEKSRVEDNLSTNNHMGYALMFSSELEVRNNVSIGDHNRGVLLNYVNDSQIENNRVLGGNTTEKCLFIYNANFNTIQDNHLESCELGIHFTAGSQGNRIFQNGIYGNRNQVKYVGTRFLEWSVDGVGNYWSDHLAFDRDRDGIADNAYRPNSLVDQIIWRHHSARVLLNSPAFQLLHWAQARFPALHPGGIVDSAPLMRAPMGGNTGG